MAFLDYASRFPHIAATPYKCVHSLVDGTIVKSIMYVELYCDEVGCDCRRVMVYAYDVATPLESPFRSAHPHKKAGFLASLNFGWEPLSFYRAWGRGFSEAEIADLTGPGLQPEAPTPRGRRGPGRRCERSSQARAGRRVARAPRPVRGRDPGLYATPRPRGHRCSRAS